MADSAASHGSNEGKDVKPASSKNIPWSQKPSDNGAMRMRVRMMNLVQKDNRSPNRCGGWVARVSHGPNRGGDWVARVLWPKKFSYHSIIMHLWSSTVVCLWCNGGTMVVRWWCTCGVPVVRQWCDSSLMIL